MWKHPRFWSRSSAIAAVLLWCLLWIGPLGLVATSPDSITPEVRFGTWFDYLVFSLGVTLGGMEPLLRASAFLLPIGIILISYFGRSPLLSVPGLLLGVFTAEVAIHWLYPRTNMTSEEVVGSTVLLIIGFAVMMVVQASLSLLPKCDRA
jgi:hypothetical protein